MTCGGAGGPCLQALTPAWSQHQLRSVALLILDFRSGGFRPVLAWKDGALGSAGPAFAEQKHTCAPANQDQSKDPLKFIELSDWAVCVSGEVRTRKDDQRTARGRH